MILGLVLLAALLTGAPALADDATAPGLAPPPATVKYFNRDIVTLRAPYYGVLPVDRASQTVGRIREALAKNGPGAVKMVATPEGLSVTIDGAYVFRILEGDLDNEDGQTFDEARVVVGKRLEEAIAAARSGVRGRDLAYALTLTLVATVAFLGALWLLVRVRVWLRRRLEAHLAARLRVWELERTRITRIIRTFGHFIFLSLGAVLAEEWLRFVFGRFAYTRPWSEKLTSHAGDVLSQVLSAMVDAAPGVGMVMIIAGLAHLANRVIGAAALGIKAGRYRLFGIDQDTVALARRLAGVIVWLFALAMAYPYLPGAGSDAFKGLSVLVGLMLSLGASGLVGQAAGGFILTFGHVLRPGDWVRVGEVEGIVKNVGMFTTRVRTPTEQEVTVPNTVLLNNVTRNFSRPAVGESTTVLETSVTIGYNAPWRQVHAMLLEAAARTPDLEREPPPRVVQTALGDFYVQYSLWVRLRDQSRRPYILSVLNANVQDVFNEYGVQIMSPHYMHDPAAPVVVAKEHWFEPPARSNGY